MKGEGKDECGERDICVEEGERKVNGGYWLYVSTYWLRAMGTLWCMIYTTMPHHTLVM